MDVDVMFYVAEREWLPRFITFSSFSALLHLAPQDLSKPSKTNSLSPTLFILFHSYLYSIAMPYTIIVESADVVLEDQIALMGQTLNVLGEDPAVHYARWTRSTGTSYECEMRITVDGKHLAMMTGIS
ncbi:hypothetical protein L873DRAFT_1840406 [Choiromyces venosus 120613-1]|uniref:Uncharacterized protein n=1 Tax=Choiromyces venosus 120613-1 TaxID=1336337 RepID=A0A3N4K2W2_9PEZI|nr:hypothetical protein L873DRAFT_1840406 [Choiromyces venosus 120613-1]